MAINNNVNMYMNTHYNDKTVENSEVIWTSLGEKHVYGEGERLSTHNDYGNVDITYINGNNQTVMQEKIMTSSNTEYKQRYYDDFGYTDDIEQGFGYNGEALDETGLIYLRARYYNPKIGQFIQADSYQGQSKDIESQNRYAYAHNNPYKNVDRNGHWIRVSSDNPYRPGENSDNYWTGKRMDALSNRKNKESDNEKDPWKKAKLEEEARKAAAYSNKLRKQMGAKPRPNNKAEKKLRPAPKYDVFGFLGKWTGKIFDGLIENMISYIKGFGDVIAEVVKSLYRTVTEPGTFLMELWEESIEMVQTPEFWAGGLALIGVVSAVATAGGSALLAAVAGIIANTQVSVGTSFITSGFNMDEFLEKQGVENVAELLGRMNAEAILGILTVYAGTKIKGIASKKAKKSKKPKNKKNNNKGASGANSIFNKGKEIFKKFNINDAYVKPKHLSTSGGNGAKFLGSSKVEAELILKEAMSKGKITTIVDDGVSALGNSKFEITIDAGKAIGTKGETFIKVILSEDGGMLSAYPVK